MRSSKYKWFVLAFLMSFGLDQASKEWARQVLKPKLPDWVTVVHGYFDLRYSENAGSAFGLFRRLPSGRTFLLCIGVAALVALSYYLRKAEPGRGRFGAELGLLAGGTLGNVADRVLFGRVTDFIVWKLGAREWPTFNIADAALVIGLAAMFFETTPGSERTVARATTAKDT